MLDYEGFKLHLLEQEKAKNTIENYMDALREYDRLYTELSKENMVAYKKHLLDIRKPSTVNLRVTAMNQYCRYIGRADLGIKQAKAPKRKLSVNNVITQEEFYRLSEGLKQDGDMRGYFMVRVLAYTGARVSELVAMTAEDIDRGYSEIWNKGAIRRIYFPRTLVEECKGHFSGGLLFLNKKGHRMSTNRVRQILHDYASKYGIRKEVMHPHSFRHLFALQFLKHDKDISLLADLMGHSSVNTTAIYTQMTQQEQMQHLDAAMNW